MPARRYGFSACPILARVFQRTLKPRFPDQVHFGDVVHGLPLADNSCDAIFSSHTLEHLALEDCRPDFEQLVAAYLSNSEPPAISNFMSYTHLGRKKRPQGLRGLLRELFGISHHLWMWDFKGLAEELEEAGFRDIRRCTYGDSPDPAFLEVENADRFKWGVGIEATK